MSDFDAEELLSLNEARRYFPGRPSLSTCWRWALRGVRGVKLATIVRGGRRFVSRTAIREFITATTAAANAAAPAAAPESRAVAIRNADAELRDAGI